MFVCLFALSCTKEISDNFSDERRRYQQFKPEEAFPNLEGELIETPSGVKIVKYDSTYVMDGDMILTDSQFYALMTPVTKSAVIDDLSKKWKNYTIPYVFDPGFIHTQDALWAMESWQNNSCLIFRPKNQYDIDYIVFKTVGDGSYSNIGRIGGAQNVNIDRLDGWMGVIMHELGHVLGLFHEHTRADRDNYVNINFNNINLLKWSNFNKYTDNSSGFDIGPFDFNSIMMYSSDAFAVNQGVPVMTKKNGDVFDSNRSYISPGDIEGVKAVYGPPYHKVNTVTISNESNSGYWYYEADKYINIYADKNCTVPTVLQYPRKFRITRTTRSIMYVGNPEEVNSVVYSVVLPANTSSYYVGNEISTGQDDYGNIYNYENTTYYIEQ